MEKPLSLISRNEWIKYQWFDVSQLGDEERMMRRGFARTPDEAYQSMMEWEETAEERDEVEPEPEDEKGVLQ